MENDPQPPFDSGSLAKAKPDSVGIASGLIHDAMVNADAPPGMLALLARKPGANQALAATQQTLERARSAIRADGSDPERRITAGSRRP